MCQGYISGLKARLLSSEAASSPLKIFPFISICQGQVLPARHSMQTIKRSRSRTWTPHPWETSFQLLISLQRKTLERFDTNKSAQREQQTGLAKTVTAQDWTGPDDPENPQNWPLWQRIYHTTIPALYGFAVTFASSVYSPAVPEVAEKFGVSSTVALLGLSLYVLGLGFGPVLAAPLSETKGRRVVYLLSLPISALFILGAGLSNSFASLVICRFFAGFFGGPTLAVGAGTNVDIWPPVRRAVATSWFIMAPFFGPAIGPAVGGFSAQYKGWRWTQWTIPLPNGPSLPLLLRYKGDL